MMKYVDALNYLYEPEIATCIKVVAIFRQEGNKFRPESYNHTTFLTLTPLQHIGKDQVDAVNNLVPPRLINAIIRSY